MKWVLWVFCAVALFGAQPLRAAEPIALDIPALTQKTPYWCWAAVSEMVFGHYAVPKTRHNRFQCDLVALTLGGDCSDDCRLCETDTIGTAQRLADSLDGYQRHVGAQAFTVELDRILPFDQIAQQIDAQNPVIAGVSPSGIEYGVGMSEHAVLIVGYNLDGTGWVKVNDPMPYQKTPPYIRVGGFSDGAGSYWILFDDFVNRLVYRDSLVLIPN